VDEIVWVKVTVNRRLAKSHGYYLQHAKEVCLVGLRGENPQGLQQSVGSDVIMSERRGQSQKPEEIYQLIEQLVPNGEGAGRWGGGGGQTGERELERTGRGLRGEGRGEAVVGGRGSKLEEEHEE
jgi:hypothetical protein